MESKGSAIITAPYLSAVTGEVIVTIAQSTDDGSGVIGITLGIEQIKNVAASVQIGKEGYVLILDKDKKYIVHPTMKAGEVAEDAFYEQAYQNHAGRISYNLSGDEKMMYFTTNELTGWKIGGTMLMKEIADSVQPIFINTLVTIIACLIIGGVLIAIILRSIIRSIKQLSEQAVKVSNGVLTETIHVQSKDEIGELAQAFSQMQQNLRTLIQDVESRAEQVAASSEQLTASAQQTSASSEHVAASVQEVASSAEKQTTGVDQNVHALEEISHGVDRIVESVRVLADLSKDTSVQADEGGVSIQQVMGQMNSIHESVEKSDAMIKSLYDRSKEISNISEVISGIAQQTNLLALNAAIEAARAGEHGKGFAVVANEVRILAEQSQLSATQISELITEIQRETKESVATMEKVRQDVAGGLEVSTETIHKFKQILLSTRETAPHIDEVSSIAAQIATGVQAVSQVASQLAQIAKSNAESAEEVAASTEEQLASMQEISASSQSLATLAEELKALLNKFTY
jgi:methyl-accepting chemotaxis protein